MIYKKIPKRLIGPSHTHTVSHTRNVIAFRILRIKLNRMCLRARQQIKRQKTSLILFKMISFTFPIYILFQIK